MHPCPGNWVAIRHAVVYYARAPTHLVQDLNVGTVHVHRLYMYMCDVSMLNVYGYGIYISETNAVPLKI